MSSHADRMMGRMLDYFKKRSGDAPKTAADGSVNRDSGMNSGPQSSRGSFFPKLSKKGSVSNMHGADAEDKGVVDGVGFTEDANAQWRKQMEDAHVMFTSFRGSKNEAFFGIYDGHGGRAAVESVQKCLHKYFSEEMELQGDDQDPIKAFDESYRRTDNILLDNRCLYVGTTSVTCYIRVEEEEIKKLYIANCGDARAVLCRKRSAVRLSYDHKASDENEAKRVAEGGGQIVGKRVNGILSVSRALGDHAMKKVVVAQPYTQVETLSADDKFLIMACDGLWDVVTDDDAVKLVLEAGASKDIDVQLASKALVQFALKKGSTDNISVMVIKF